MRCIRKSIFFIYFFFVAIPLLCFVDWFNWPETVNGYLERHHVLFFLMVVGCVSLFSAVLSISVVDISKSAGARIIFEEPEWFERMICRRTSAYVPENEAEKNLVDIVSGLVSVSGVSRCPVIGLVNNTEINAFAVSNWFGGAAIVFNSGCLQLNDHELRALSAHEIAHIARGDSLVSACLFRAESIASSVADIVRQAVGGAAIFGVCLAAFLFLFAYYFEQLVLSELIKLVSGLTLVLVLALIFPFIVRNASIVFRMAVSRRQEYACDQLSSKWTSVNATISLLSRLEHTSTIVEDSYFRRLYHTHPNIKDRIEVLRNGDIGSDA